MTLTVYKRNAIVHENVDFEFCYTWLKENVSKFKDLNSDAKQRLIEFLNTHENSSLKLTSFESELKSIVNLSIDGKSCRSRHSKLFWLKRGYSDNEAQQEISNIQKSASPRSIEHWIGLGYTEKDAEYKVSEYQKQNSHNSNKKRQLGYWLELGYSEKDAKHLHEEYLDNVTGFRKGYWVNKGYSELEASKIVQDICEKGTSLEYFTNKHGEEKGQELWNELNLKKKRVGENNGQYGKEAPKGSGTGISGTYKNAYYFRSLLEYFTLKYLEENNIPFQCNDVSVHCNENKIIIPYQLEGKTKNYIPDFVIRDSEILEIKATWALSLNSVKAKTSAAYEFISGSEQYTDFVIWTEQDIPEDINTILEDYAAGLIVIDPGKKHRFNSKYRLTENESYQ